MSCPIIKNDPNGICCCDNYSILSKGRCVTIPTQAWDKKVIGGYRVIQKR
jgi:hypothetical protein